MCAGIVMERVDRCGEDGKLAIKVLSDGWNPDDLASLMHVDRDRIERRIKRVIAYCAGESARKISYKEFIQHRWNQHNVNIGNRS
jgi:hypothetical protein